jgi:hypothetical protein
MVGCEAFGLLLRFVARNFCDGIEFPIEVVQEAKKVCSF